MKEDEEHEEERRKEGNLALFFEILDPSLDEPHYV
jgi:hypothetical protein